MANIINSALASNSTNSNPKLKHWTQCIKDFESKISNIQYGYAPKNHAHIKPIYGAGSERYYGHVRLIDDIIYEYIADGTELWKRSSVTIQNNDGTSTTDTSVSGGLSGWWNDVTYHSGLFVAVGSNGRIVTSTDGVTWDDVHYSEGTTLSNYEYELKAVKWCGNCFIAVGAYNMFVYSYDGAYWSKPIYVGSVNNSGTIYENRYNQLETKHNKFRATDCWNGICYDSLTNTITLCGTQGRILDCALYSDNLSPRFVFSTTKYYGTLDITFNSIECNTNVSGSNKETRIIACGDNNYVICLYRKSNMNTITTISNDGIVKNSILQSLMQIEDNVHIITTGTASTLPAYTSTVASIGTLMNVTNQTATTGSFNWNRVTIDNGTFLLLGDKGKNVMSPSGLFDTWYVPTYDFSRLPDSITETNTTYVNCNLQAKATCENLTVVAGSYNHSSVNAANATIKDKNAKLNIVRYNSIQKEIPIVEDVIAGTVTSFEDTTDSRLYLIVINLSGSTKYYNIQKSSPRVVRSGKGTTSIGTAVGSYTYVTNRLEITTNPDAGTYVLLEGNKIYKIGNEEDGLQTTIEQLELGYTQSNIPNILHVAENYKTTSNCHWFGAAAGRDTFVLVGYYTNNSGSTKTSIIIHCKISEDSNKYAISLEFYKKYIKQLYDIISELQAKFLKTDLQYHTLHGEDVNLPDTAESFYDTDIISANNESILLYKTTGKVKLIFNAAQETTYKEISIYIDSVRNGTDSDTLLMIEGAEWENDLYMPDWGKLGCHLLLKAIFVGARVIVQIIDNDQLADNLLY